MLVQLFEYLAQYYTGFNVFGYLTLLGILAVLTALIPVSYTHLTLPTKA